MHIDIACQHTTLTQAMHDAVHQKFAKLDQHTDRPVSAHVVLSVERDRHTAEATVRVGAAHHQAKVQNQDLYQAIDTLVQRLDRSMRKTKTRQLQNQREGGATIRQAPGLG